MSQARNKHMVTPQTVADEMGWTRETVYHWLRRGWLSGEQLPNREWRIPAEELDRLKKKGAAA